MEWWTLGLTAVLVLVTGWYAFLTWRLAKSSERAAESAKLAAAASHRAALVAVSMATVEFEVEREYVPRDQDPESRARLSLRASGLREAEDDMVLDRLYIYPVEASVFVHGAELLQVATGELDTPTEHIVEKTMQGSGSPQLLHADESMTFVVPALFDPDDPLDRQFAARVVNGVVCRVLYSFDGSDPVRHRIVANYPYDRGIND